LADTKRNEDRDQPKEKFKTHGGIICCLMAQLIMEPRHNKTHNKTPGIATRGLYPLAYGLLGLAQQQASTRACQKLRKEATGESVELEQIVVPCDIL